MFPRVYDQFTQWMYKETDPSSLAVVRFLFGVLMMVDIVEERGGSDLDIRWGEPRDCHFPLFTHLQPLPLTYMSLLYGVMWLGALGIAIGCKFRISCLMFCVPYWYIFLLDKSYWNNHSYLYGLIGILLLCSSAHNYCMFPRVYDQFTQWMYKETDPSSLAVVRFLFGVLMMVDIVEERGGSDLDIRWGEPRDCHFPLFTHLQPLPLTYMSLLYGVMWLGALGIAIGCKFRISCLMFCVPYWYIFLLDKSYWNNHSYLYGLIGILLLCSSAHNYWSIDSYFNGVAKTKDSVPYWNYFLLKFQLFVLYFLAGLKKTDMEWLEGYSMRNLGVHWVFAPFKVVLTGEQIDYIIVHWFGFLLDLTVGFLLVCGKTRPLGMLMCSTFHLMNTRLFSIGMFPYVCLATMPIFCEFDWPKRCMNKICRSKIDNANNAGGNGNNATNTVPTTANDGSSNDPNRHRRRRRRIGFREKLVSGLILTYCGLQGFLPYSHFITKGYNNWTNGLYGYSWDMMIHSWDTVLVVVRVVDNLTGKEHFLDPSAWVQNNRWTKHADMTMQYAHCLKNNLLLELDDAKFLGDSKSISQYITSDNISIYVDVWCSLNGRLQQRMYDPNYDLLQAEWSVFEQAEWLLPLLSEYNDYRSTITGIQEHVYSWSNYTDVLFIADFPGLYLENYISQDLANVSLTILEGEVIYEDELKLGSVRLRKDGRKFVPTGIFHKVHTVSATPSCYIYTYLNKTRERLKEEDRPLDWEKATRSPFPLLEDRTHLAEGTGRMFGFIVNAILNVLYDVPMVRRTKVT